jgi:putative DNA methylase
MTWFQNRLHQSKQFKISIMTKIYSPKKLIEVALPLDDINAACAHEKQPGIGAHPRGLHLWWARRPLPAARAVIFAQMVNDPGYQDGEGFKFGVNKKEAEIKREKLFQIIRDLVKWENTNNEAVLNRAREAIKESWRETCHLNRKHPEAAELFNPELLPAFHDPFAGGGAIPLEAQRLGLESYASDLNPVAVMINKAMIEIPPKFAGQAPVGPIPKSDKTDKKKATKDVFEDWPGAQGLAEDVRRYGHWMREEAYERIGHLYPKVAVTEEMAKEREDLKPYVGEQLTVIVWLWTRTVKCPNPACGCDMPLLSSMVLSSKKGKEAYVIPVEGRDLKFQVTLRKPEKIKDAKKGFKRGISGIFECYKCGSTTTRNYTAEQATSVGLGSAQTAVVCEGRKGRIYLSPQYSRLPKNIPEADRAGLIIEMSPNPRDVWCRNFGLNTPADLFTPRQLVATTTFSDLVQEARTKAIDDAKAAGMTDHGLGIDAGGKGATAYGDALAVYLTFSVDRLADYNSSIATWKASGEQVMQTYKRQALPMTWDFPESNILGEKSICWLKAIKYTSDNLKACTKLNSLIPGTVTQSDAATQSISTRKVISTDPPYYDNIGYADLSDFFYVWMRRSLRNIYPYLFSTMVVPKAEELVAAAYRHGSKENAENFFLDGMTQAIHNMTDRGHPAFPVTIYYAFKQAETKEGSTSSTGWETFLEAVIRAGFSIDGTWPMRTELSNRMIAAGTNALASSVVLVCKKRGFEAESISRREFKRELRNRMPDALETMIGGETGTTPIAPVDLAQAAIGPGMALYSKYEAVLNQDGGKMSVHEALILINRAITDYLNPDSGNFDNDTLFCDDWFSQYGWSEGQFGVADTLARAKGTSVDGVKEAGVIASGSGKVRLLKWGEYPTDWDPKTDNRTPVWEACHHLIRAINQNGESAAGTLLARMPERGETIRQLAYHLYTLCERKKWADDARAYNELIGSWNAIVAASHDVGHRGTQIELDF